MKIAFTAEEMSYLLSLGNLDLFNTILSLDVVHGSTIDMFQLYADRRMALTDNLPAEMEGLLGTIAIAPLDHPTLAPRVAELQKLAEDISLRVADDAEESKKAMFTYAAAIKVTLGSEIVLGIDQSNAEQKLA